MKQLLKKRFSIFVAIIRTKKKKEGVSRTFPLLFFVRVDNMDFYETD